MMQLLALMGKPPQRKTKAEQASHQDECQEHLSPQLQKQRKLSGWFSLTPVYDARGPAESQCSMSSSLSPLPSGAFKTFRWTLPTHGILEPIYTAGFHRWRRGTKQAEPQLGSDSGPPGSTVSTFTWTSLPEEIRLA
ncbi:hypothetical protein AAFF_G00279490 [Aldrovandia affinis]|uniref:Uncharacterized protein n=1 Tax=Aldrovandia affinis TaxID=143900 RepID=A0AAD7SRD1_9TELE|nr:hypothetical protein AAFF_G00279490 [Aldrovandia affinis]